MPGGPSKPSRADLPALARTTGERNGVVEEADMLELRAGDELVEEGRAGQRSLGELRECALARLVVRLPPQREAEHAGDERLVRGLVREQVGAQT